ncbi:tRNA (adenine(22)-N(1))-methyltransferase TrmK [Enterococcus dongliensis]|uniref:tRNA (Adenine(22)-N(1))-methyltransferase TrmK n=1 Tax=Enterococcus dongliensis TaxID=2559925 RepID=A0AAP5KPB1_9ENTE|nr:tRNA (adenine(22)-N(1))-methyltransferase TrmK [Enterococcus dongliensis]MDT2595887.1 tRNA (adenine(22)-N(1))-methyltransferase TrmK [Enterococcus dongliensis]MDT2602852.1 tRNA (adenine(22)-N(1))-methyltransferase TrmK [Enterococcus dongliensis]MDT2633954.1 tRNA (adenine(22)-N(1))-methyltransferase TrmK [Enterococcus dongliensis]MDT2637284.1 tRNA (adenine(22)-N(1))-methyltransferase TrmK [Enterococcus dongliensis]MDT2639624.1 tRNA (adenine(22)-N(1))-methyltransferase TrmK [Enterococcus dong
MNAKDLSNRLQKAAEFVPQGAILADIGSDHAYLPVALMLQGKIAHGIAGEVVVGPYESAKKQVAKNGLTEKIDVRLADGLDAVVLNDHVSTVTICGMGGVLIRDILQRGKENQRLSGKERLILQPNVGERQLRTWLVNENYQLTDEAIVAENQKIYEIIVAEKVETTPEYSAKELFFGPVLLKEKNSIFLEKWRHKLIKSEKILASLRQSDQDVAKKIENVAQEIKWIKEVLADAGK